MNTERKLGIEISVTEEEVEECKRKAAEIEERLKKEKEEEEEYLIFKPEAVREDNIYIGRWIDFFLRKIHLIAASIYRHYHILLGMVGGHWPGMILYTD